ncbi:MAG: acyl-CoA dehydrogenase family protein [Thermodesulfobacteriota bacterium]|nr:acyl-CoA dehydrogenase family protein [Thermodesulfobacteriota bacterium]
MDFFLQEDQRIFQETFRKFAEREIAPLVEEAEETETFPLQIFPQMGKLGYLCPRYSEKYGGAGIDKVSEVVMREEISRVSQGFASTWSAHSHLGTFPVYHWGSEEQKQKYLVPAIRGEKIFAFGLTEPNAGSDVKAIETTARPEGNFYVLNGRKIFITNGNICDFLTLVAYTDRGRGYKGISLFLVEKGTPGFIVSRKLKKEGVRSSETAELLFEDCRIPKENRIGEEGSFYRVMETLNEGRIGVAGNCVGMAQGAYEAALRYAQERVQFGRPIAHFQAIAFKLADMAMEIDASRLLTLRAAWLMDQGKNPVKEASMAKLFASEVAVRVSMEAMQIHGGYGQMREFPVGRFHRDALVYVVGEGTSEIQRQIIAKQMGIGE